MEKCAELRECNERTTIFFHSFAKIYCYLIERMLSLLIQHSKKAVAVCHSQTFFSSFQSRKLVLITSLFINYSIQTYLSHRDEAITISQEQFRD